MARVFISYRREDSAASAGRIQDRLERELGRDHLFIDVDGIPLGANFVKVLRKEVTQCGVLLAVIGPNWLDVRDDDGTRRLENPTDVVRIEIAAALQREIPVIPILLDGTSVPKADQLPEDLKELALRNGLNVHHASFHADLDKLIRELKRQAPRQAVSTPITTSTPPRAENDPNAREPLAGGMPDPLNGISAKNQVNAAEGDLTRAPLFPNRAGARARTRTLPTEPLPASSQRHASSQPDLAPTHPSMRAGEENDVTRRDALPDKPLSGDVDFQRAVDRGTLETLRHATKKGDLSGRLATLDKLRILAHHFPDDAAVREVLASGLIETLRHARRHRDLSLRDALIDDLRALARTYPDDSAVRKLLMKCQYMLKR
jgi:hypothetical protein